MVMAKAHASDVARKDFMLVLAEPSSKRKILRMIQRKILMMVQRKILMMVQRKILRMIQGMIMRMIQWSQPTLHIGMIRKHYYFPLKRRSKDGSLIQEPRTMLPRIEGNSVCMSRRTLVHFI